MELLAPLEGLYRQDPVPINNDLWLSLRGFPLNRELTLDEVILSHTHIVKRSECLGNDETKIQCGKVCA